MKTLKKFKYFVAGYLLIVVAAVTITFVVARPPKEVKTTPIARFHSFPLNQKAIERAKAYTVLISNEGFGGLGRGTGVLLDSTHVLTCAHMIQSGDDDMWIFPYPVHQVVKGHPVFGNRSYDLAILELETPVNSSTYAVFNTSPTVGEPITIIGNTLGAMQWFVSYGVVSGEKSFYLLTDGLIKGGNSGGPWINDAGEIVALTDWGLQNREGKEEGISGGVRAEAIVAFIADWKSPMTSLQMLLRQLN